MKIIKMSEIQIGDTIKCYEGEWGYAVVKKIENGEATIFRPYGATADFSYTGGVICYVGIEEYKTPMTNAPVELWRRQELK